MEKIKLPYGRKKLKVELSGEQLKGKLLSLIDLQRQEGGYPLVFLCFKIKYFRRKKLAAPAPLVRWFYK